MNRVARAVLAVAVLVAGAALVYTAPDTDDVSSPIEFRGTVGDRITGRLFDATVTRVRLAENLRLADSTVVSTPGVFVVVDARITPHLRGATFSASTLRVGRTSYASYTDPQTSDFTRGLRDPGITVESSLAFEVPASVRRATSAEIVLSVGALNPDQVNVVEIRPDRIAVADRVEIVPQGQVDRDAP